ncbi:hypothetical protein EXIGLDRAFT_740760 [Exidia glandulosa HHB12029]|uniref:18S rRNA factor 2 n=1 Tax=Exidia glandulosa HHB12029 TaxID=1314781 RepID=A0A165GGT5_EXIGL|nr:hypothetical protein EXIGLDRAFT_740760 [Exidia glandulosa HHB12029]
MSQTTHLAVSLAPSPVVNPLSPEELAKFQAAQDRAGIVYLSRIPPGMRPTKVRHLMSAHGEVGRVFLQQEDPKRAYLRRKHTSTKKAHYTEGWVEFADKKVARSVAALLNAQPIGGKKGSRWRDDVWTMKYLPRFKWNMLTEQISHEAAVHRERLRIELSQSKTEQRDYLRNVEIARVLKKREEKKKAKGDEDAPSPRKRKELPTQDNADRRAKRPKANAKTSSDAVGMDAVLSSIF